MPFTRKMDIENGSKEDPAKRKLLKTDYPVRFKRVKNNNKIEMTNLPNEKVKDMFNDSIEHLLANAGNDLMFGANTFEKEITGASCKPIPSPAFTNKLLTGLNQQGSEDMFLDEALPSFMESQFSTKSMGYAVPMAGFGNVLKNCNNVFVGKGVAKTTYQAEEYDNDSVFDQIPPTCKLANKENQPQSYPNVLPEISRDNPPQNTNDSLCGLTNLLKENVVVDGDKDSSNIVVQKESSDISISVMNRLLLNASKAAVLSPPKSTGWTQFRLEMSQSFLVKDSQFHEIGPYYGLPSSVKELVLKHKGIKELYDWQIECLNLPAVNERKNLVYALPTSGGKTLVAEILMLREILCRRKSVLFVLPFVAIVQEKVRSLSPFAVDLGFLVEEYAAGKGLVPPRKRRRRNTIYVATIEKALAVVHSLIEAGRLSELGLVVVDELHLISEGSGRGAALEAMLTYIMHSKEKIHAVGMSATIGNINEIATFLHAETYLGTFRPVELTEYVTCSGEVFAINIKEEDPLVHVRNLKTTQKDPDGLYELVQEVYPEGSVLVFCPTKKNCENVASLLFRQLPREVLDRHKAEKTALIKTLKADSNGKLCPILCGGIRHGIAYHHSGLTSDERKLVEEAFREGIIFCICCTSTLAAGVNLPAQRVILRAPYIGREFINISRYKQMIGRAGRAGYGSRGESFLICQTVDTAKVNNLLKSRMDDAISSLNVENCKDLVLSAVGLGIATTRKQLRHFLQQSLLHVQADRLKVNVRTITDQCITSLYKQGALRVAVEEFIPDKSVNNSRLDVSVTRGKPERKMLRISNSAQLSISRLGKAALRGCMSLPTALKLYGDLERAEGSLVLLCSLHILYLVTPYQLPEQMTPNYQLFFHVFMKLSDKEQIAAKAIGLTENQVSRMGMGQKPKNIAEETLNRFYVTLILNELWKQQSVWDVAALFQIPRGLVQNLMSSAASFSWNVLRFCEELEELWSVKAILAEFSPRMAYCCEAELLPLMDLPAIKRSRARQFFNAGYKTLHQIATAETNDLVAAISHLPARSATQIIAAARLMLMQKIENLHEEAEEVLQNLGKNSLEELLNKV